MKGLCPICGQQKSNLWEHLTRIHQMDGKDRQKWLDQAKRQKTVGTKKQASFYNKDGKCEAFHLKHPFTCMVSGMTGCGKTTWVKRLLENRAQTIRPEPQRIVWFYSIWQPAYSEMMESIPNIEFVRGIPATIENDNYFDVSVRNLVVIDDQMSTASNDKQVIKLFTQGSHHRNLSVVYLVQNLFHQGKGNRDISLNCHYLVIFKNPRDKLQILTLAKQMYPKKTQSFLEKYEEAVSRPYGYLFIDLKTTTADHCRLRTNVLPGERYEKDASIELSKELLKYLDQKSVTDSPIKTILKNLREKMDKVLTNPSMNNDEKARTYAQLQSMFSQYKSQLESANRRGFPLRIMGGSLPSEGQSAEDLESEIEELLHELPEEQHDELPQLGIYQSPQINQIVAPSNIATPESVPLPPSPTALETYESPLAEPQISAGSYATLTPPPTVSPRKSSRKIKLKNSLDDDSQNTYGPYMSPMRLRSSRNLRQAYHPYKKL